MIVVIFNVLMKFNNFKDQIQTALKGYREILFCIKRERRYKRFGVDSRLIWFFLLKF